MYRRVGKRILDLVGSLVLICLCSPIFFAVFVFGVVFNSGHPFFVQERIGRDERSFKVIKFRTMNNRRDSKGVLLSDRDRLTEYGKVLRRTSIDELPQLINIARGDMSFIGPRPLLVQYLPHYSPEERRRHSVRPGITGLAQISGRNSLNWEERFSYDLEYVDNLSLRLDLQILLRTLTSVMTASGVRTDVSTGELRNLDDERKNRG